MLSKKVISIILIITFIISIILSTVIPPKLFENSRFNHLLKIFSSLAIIFIGVGLVLTADALENSQELNKTLQTYSLIDRALLNPIDKMQKLYDKCPNFIRSLWPQKNIFNDQTSSTGPNKDDNMAILDLSMTIFQAIEDHFTGNKFDLTGEAIWEGNFLQWTNSEKLYEMWKILYPNFKSPVNNYIKLLFSYSLGVEISDGDKLAQLVNQLSNDRNLKTIIASAQS